MEFICMSCDSVIEEVSDDNECLECGQKYVFDPTAPYKEVSLDTSGSANKEEREQLNEDAEKELNETFEEDSSDTKDAGLTQFADSGDIEGDDSGALWSGDNA